MNEHDIVGEIELPQINQKCRECPFLCDIHHTFEEASIRKLILTHIGEKAMDDEELQAIFQDAVPEDVNVEEMIQVSRQNIGASLESVDGDISQLTHIIEAAQLSCEGVLKMRARKGNREYTVSVCTSDEANANPAVLHVPTHVRTRDIPS